MDTLRAAALILNGLLLSMVAWGFREGRTVRDASDWLFVAFLISCPVVNAVTILLQSRRSN